MVMWPNGLAAGTGKGERMAIKSSTDAVKGFKQIIAVSVGLFLVFLDTTIVNVALPYIAQDLQIGLRTASWIIHAFVITVAALLIAFGRLANIVGNYRTYMVGLFVFMAASLLCGFAPNVASLIVFRVLQGVGAAAIIPASFMLVRATVPSGRSHLALGVWGGIGLFAIAIGPVLGGIVTTFLNWEWVFLINLPFIAIFTPIATLAFSNYKEKRRPFFLPDESGIKEPALKTGLLRNPVFIAGMVANFLSGVLLMGALILLPVYFTRVKEYDLLTASLMVTPLSAMILVVAPLIRRLIRSKRYLIPMWIGFLFATAGFFLLSILWAGISNGGLIVMMAVAGTGIGILMVTSATIGTTVVPEGCAGQGLAIYATARYTGGALGVALFVSLMLGFAHGYSAKVVAEGIESVLRADLPALIEARAVQFLEERKTSFFAEVGIARVHAVTFELSRVEQQQLAEAGQLQEVTAKLANIEQGIRATAEAYVTRAMSKGFFSGLILTMLLSISLPFLRGRGSIETRAGKNML